MRDKFDRRVISETAMNFLHVAQQVAPWRLGGGAALAGAWLSHRLSRDLDLFFRDRATLRRFLFELPSVAGDADFAVDVVRDSGTHVRASLNRRGENIELDLVHDALPDQDPVQPSLEGIQLVPFADLRAAKLTCLLSRAEPRDLTDVLFLERAGYTPESDIALALAKDAGVDPSTLAWLVRDFPVRPMPLMLEPLSEADLVQYRDDLAQRFKRLAIDD